MNMKYGLMLMMFIINICFVLQNRCQTTSGNRLFLENQYGAEIVCKVKNGNSNIPSMVQAGMPIHNKETPIAHGVRVLLGLVPFDPKLRNVWANDINIKTSRYLPISSYTSLDDYVNENCTRDLHACCNMKLNSPICKQGICNKDAVIVVKPSGITSGWDISVRWETTRGVTEFEMK